MQISKFILIQKDFPHLEIYLRSFLFDNFLPVNLSTLMSLMNFYKEHGLMFFLQNFTIRLKLPILNSAKKD